MPISDTPTARPGVTVTRLQCDPLPIKHVLKYRDAGRSGRCIPLQLSVQNNTECRALVAACGAADRAMSPHTVLGQVLHQVPRAFEVALSPARAQQHVVPACPRRV
jgi:hypothetical protein